ncbi:unnamed protein product [Toxocara canis]|uniref:BTB domain-containing protein n=1 Tax=Toxocara canis TaxID=6265 RepID=A0A183UJN8_TOXCA|nr:unnamed protein product [Toxocara canis]
MKAGRIQRSAKLSRSLRSSSQEVPSQLSLEEIIWRIPGADKTINVQDDIQCHLSKVGMLLSCDKPIFADMILRLGHLTMSTHSSSVLAHSPLIAQRLDEGGRPQQRWPVEVDLSDLRSRNLSTEGLQIVVEFISTGSVSLEEGSLPHALIAANLLEVCLSDVEALLKLLCEQMAVMATRNPRSAYVMLETAVHSLPRHSEYRSIVVDAVAQLFPSLQSEPLFLKV